MNLFRWIGRQINKVPIRKFLSSCTISKIDTLTGVEFEDLCKLMFTYCDYDVETTKASNDYGADLILNKKLKIVVQCKLYYNHGVGNKAVQEVTSALKYYHAHFAVVITNWQFTKQAKNMALVQNVLLIDRDDIIMFLDDVRNKTKKSKMFDLQKHFTINVVDVDKI